MSTVWLVVLVVGVATVALKATDRCFSADASSRRRLRASSSCSRLCCSQRWS
jgi:hypothetical protein